MVRDESPVVSALEILSLERLCQFLLTLYKPASEALHSDVTYYNAGLLVSAVTLA